MNGGAPALVFSPRRAPYAASLATPCPSPLSQRNPAIHGGISYYQGALNGETTRVRLQPDSLRPPQPRYNHAVDLPIGESRPRQKREHPDKPDWIGYAWPASRLTEAHRRMLCSMSNRMGVPITQVLADAIRKMHETMEPRVAAEKPEGYRKTQKRLF